MRKIKDNAVSIILSILLIIVNVCFSYSYIRNHHSIIAPIFIILWSILALAKEFNKIKKNNKSKLSDNSQN